jgi:lipopolysaccharide biosynthesis glycosyltransferase
MLSKKLVRKSEILTFAIIDGVISDHFNAGVSMIRIDRWRQRNLTAQIEDWIDFLNEHPTLVSAGFASECWLASHHQHI